jgi:DNA-binding XRE family transcriptional regulator
MARNFNQLRAPMSAERRARIAAKTRKLIEEMPLEQVRAARQLTQEHLAKLLKVPQSSISRLEHRSDMYFSTLADFIKAMGGELEVRAVFPEGEIKITGLGDLNNPAT